MIEKILAIFLFVAIFEVALSITTDLTIANNSLAEICENEYGTTYLAKSQFRFGPNGCLYIDEVGESQTVFFDYIDNKWIKRAEASK